jgi:type IV pilus assembly protein PilB
MATDEVKIQDQAAELAQARTFAASARYRCGTWTCAKKSIDQAVRSIPVDLMFRFWLRAAAPARTGRSTSLADPRNLGMIDELALLLGEAARQVTTLSQISTCKKTEQSQRVLEEVTEGFTLDVVGDEENQDETLSIDRLSAADSDIAPSSSWSTL